jgi:hypothetical protein
MKVLAESVYRKAQFVKTSRCDLMRRICGTS